MKRRLVKSVSLAAGVFGQITFALGNRKDVYIDSIHFVLSGVTPTDFAAAEYFRLQLTTESAAAIVDLGRSCYYRYDLSIVSAVAAVELSKYENLKGLLLPAAENIYVGGISGAAGTLSVQVVITEKETT